MLDLSSCDWKGMLPILIFFVYMVTVATVILLIFGK